MRNQPRPSFVAMVLDALPANGAPISSRGVFLALGEISTPSYVRIVLRQLAIAGNVIATGPSGQRVYRRLPAQQCARCRERDSSPDPLNDARSERLTLPARAHVSSAHEGAGHS